VKHTPGSWYASNGVVWADEQSTVALARVPYNEGTEEERANVQLMAAAPDLYDAVLMLLGSPDLNFEEMEDATREAIECARAALQKAGL
jgi:hypothetical protein